MDASPACYALIKHFEGCRLTAYADSVGVWTIGYGHTKGVTRGQTITEAEADDLLRQDVAVAESGVRRNVKVPLTQGQFDALVSFVFNLGSEQLAESTLLRKLNASRYEEASAEFSRWVHAGGVELPGLVKRRAAERALFDSNAGHG